MSRDGRMFPRELASYERELLLWLLPEERPGYREYRALIEAWTVVGQGRRGEGNYILAPAGYRPDVESPLPQLFAYGVVVTTGGELSVSVRERSGDQLEYEIVSLHGEVNPTRFVEVRRWTFSTWFPSYPCPICASGPREIRMQTSRGEAMVLAICATDRRLWVYDARTGVNHPIPITNFYNELMLHKNIRDPERALDSRRLFSELEQYSDRDFAKAFQSYNNLRTKVALEGVIVLQEPRRSFWQKLKSALHLP